MQVNPNVFQNTFSPIERRDMAERIAMLASLRTNSNALRKWPFWRKMVLQFKPPRAFNYRDEIMNRSTHLEIDLCFLLGLVISFICLLTVEMIGEGHGVYALSPNLGTNTDSIAINQSNRSFARSSLKSNAKSLTNPSCASGSSG